MPLYGLCTDTVGTVAAWWLGQARSDLSVQGADEMVE